VIGLDLSCSILMGVFPQNSNLFRLSHLQKLNLSFNSFNLSKISPNIGGLSNLTRLDLSSASFGRIVPSELSHLSWNPLIFHSGDFQILLSNLTNIRVLSLGSVDMISTAMPANWSSSLTYLNLKFTELHGLLPNFIFHLPRLQTFILYDNKNLSISLPENNVSTDFISSFTSLRSLSLERCGLCGPFPNSIANLSQIVELHLWGVILLAILRR
jgi:hypothetical protein